MQIKTTEGNYNVASQGVGVGALTTGIIGTAGWLLNGGLNNLLNFGNGNGKCQIDETKPILYSELVKEKSERYAEGIGISTFKEAQLMNDKTNDRVLSLERFVYELDKKIAVERQQTVDNFAFLNNEISNAKKEIMCYVNATFVPGKLSMPLDAICPAAQPASTTTTGA